MLDHIMTGDKMPNKYSFQILLFHSDEAPLVKFHCVM
jgi:hypothetical protein